MTTKLCTEPITEGASAPLIDAVFNGHPSYISETPEMVVDAIKTLKVPYSCAVAQNDMQFNEAVAEKTEAMVKGELGASSTEGAGQYVYDFKIYEGCVHGFCVRAKEDEENMKGYEEAVKQAVEWFNKYLN